MIYRRKRGKMATEYFHEKTSYALDPLYKTSVFSTGSAYHLGPMGALSSALDPRTANQVKEVQEVLNTGIKNIEVGNVAPNVFEAIPKEHFKEMQRMAKLTGAELSFHAPMVDPTGITEHGWDKMNQEAAERQFWSSIQKGAELNPKGTVVTFHATSVGLPGAEVKAIEEGKEKVKSLLYVTPDGRIGQIKAEERFFPTETGKPPKEFIPEEELKRRNRDAWSENLGQLNFYAHRGEEVASQIEEFPKEKVKQHPELAAMDIEREISHGDLYLRDAYRMLKTNFDMIYKGALQSNDTKTLNALNEYRDKIASKIQKFEKPIKNTEDLKEFSQETIMLPKVKSKKERISCQPKRFFWSIIK